MEPKVIHRTTGVTDDPSRSWSLPAWAYLDPEIHEREKRQIFYRTWAYAGWVGDVAAPGDYLTAERLDQSVIILRGRDGELQGFHNVCQHRGHQLLKGAGTVASITCPYHAWVYDLDGSLKRARGSERTPGFEPGCIALKPVRVEVLADKFVFYNLDPDAAPLGPQVPDFLEDVRREIPEFDSLVRVTPRPRPPDEERDALGGMFPVKANWKIVMDNFLECYHCPGAHPGFMRDLTFDDLTYVGHELWAKQKSGTRRPSGAEQIFWTLFPTLTFGASTKEAPLIGVIDFAVPEGPALTHAGRYDLYGLPSDEDVVVEHPDWGPLGFEDRSLCESVQKGLASLGYDPGRLIYDPDNGGNTEAASHAFQRFVVRALGL